MKIGELALIFLVIVIPMSIILSEFVNFQTEIIRLQIIYDDKLNSATADAMKAFKSNTLNSSTTDLVNSKIRDIEASVNVFFDSVASEFNRTGYTKDTIREYIPAVVFTMYDGYYIYSPFTNHLVGDENFGTTYQNDINISDLKPYIYYSCRYKKGTNYDFIINYALDNYIQIVGLVNGKVVNDSGYLINNCTSDGNTAQYRGIDIKPSIELEEFVFDPHKQNLENKKYNKINGTKYYKEPGANRWATISDDKKQEFDMDIKLKNKSAVIYYKEAEDFRNRIIDEINGYNLKEIKSTDAVDEAGNKIFQEEQGYPTYDIFNFEKDNINIEEPNSDFNQHKRDIIKYSIEKNLSIAIANFNKYSDAKTNFQMPKLREDEWDNITNNISIIGFLQGINMGGKAYNGYSIKSTDISKEFVGEDDIYIVTNDGYAHNPLEQGLNTKGNMVSGYLKIDFEQKSTFKNNNQPFFYYPHEELLSYDSILGGKLEDITNSNIYDYMESLGNTELPQLYLTTLARERMDSHKVGRNNTKNMENYK